MEALEKLGQRSKVTLAWVSGHTGIQDNETADGLAKQGAQDDTEISPVGVPFTTELNQIKNIGADTTCRFYEEDKENSLHLLCDCPALAIIRYHHWGVDFLSKDQLADKRVTEILRLTTKAKLMV
ncbi:hypothetical protein PV325_009359 [Microctonus aethiopoides]|nr:hypothetical protein PV325_009359 [Microctonus aethiopoides]